MIKFIVSFIVGFFSGCILETICYNIYSQTKKAIHRHKRKKYATVNTVELSRLQ